MGERKVLNKYYPLDFDPAKINRRRRFNNNQQIKVRTMLPMTIRCNTCGNYMYPGTKVNARKEQVMKEETYLGIKCFRFYFKCTNCSAEIVKKTDPKNSDYVLEAGATRCFEPRKEEVGDAMKSLEDRSLDLKWEMDVLASLEELKSMKARRVTFGVDTLLEALKDKKKMMMNQEEDEALIKSIFHMRRIQDDDEIANNVCVKKLKLSDGLTTMTHLSEDHELRKIKTSQQTTLLGPAQRVKFMVMRKPVPVSKEDTALCSGLQSLCQYDSDDE